MEITKAHTEGQTEYYARKIMHDNKIETLILRYIKQGILKKRPVRAENVIAYVLKTYKRATKAEVAKIYHELKFTPTFVNARD